MLALEEPVLLRAWVLLLEPVFLLAVFVTADLLSVRLADSTVLAELPALVLLLPAASALLFEAVLT